MRINIAHLFFFFILVPFLTSSCSLTTTPEPEVIDPLVGTWEVVSYQKSGDPLFELIGNNLYEEVVIEFGPRVNSKGAITVTHLFSVNNGGTADIMKGTYSINEERTLITITPEEINSVRSRFTFRIGTHGIMNLDFENENKITFNAIWEFDNVLTRHKGVAFRISD